jgi:pimeloyl-ACP methyl ester carboxylesterase
MTTQFATSSDQIHIAFEVHGDGPPLMLLHGGGTSRLDWFAGGYMDRLREEFSVIAVDLRGHGESDKPLDPTSYTSQKMGDDLLAVADACGFERFLLCGYSFGGKIARYQAARSQRVSKCELISSSFGPGVSGEWRMMSLDFRARWAPVVFSQLGDPPQGTFNPQLLSPTDLEAANQLSFPSANIPVVMAWSTAMLAWPQVSPKEILCPTLWLFGSENPHAKRSCQQYENDLPGSRVQVHIMENFDHTQEFTSIDHVLPVWWEFVSDK